MNNSNEQLGLTQSVSNELVNTSIDLGTEYSEMIIDSFLADGILKEIPFVKTIYAVGKLGFSIKERLFVKKLFVFLKEFHTGMVEAGKLEKFREDMRNDDKYKNKVTEHLIVYTDAFLEMNKAKIFARLFLAHLNGNYNWEHFLHVSKCLNDLHPKAIQYLNLLSNCNFSISSNKEAREMERNYEDEALLMSCGIAHEPSPWASGFAVTEIGKDLYNFGIKEEPQTNI